MSLHEDLIQIVPQAGERFAAAVPMSAHTTFRIGGPADIYFEPASPDEIERVARFCRANGLPLTILGNGSNILVSDRGIRGVVMAIGEPMAAISRQDDLVVAGAGARLASLAAFAAQNGLSGLEFASGIPGTIGGAVLMNAGAYDRCMADVVVLTEYFDENLDLRAAVREENQFAYRRSVFSGKHAIILRVCLQLKPDDPQAILARMAELNLRRRTTQPLDLPSAGSAFKRPAGHYAGKLISDCGLKGCRIGNAQVSEKHAGFIVNLGDACAADTRRLFDHVRQVVSRETGVELEPEVRFIGEWQESDAWPKRKGEI
jgi:UDP-N-acetylmuramate dehydrogenase